jgi:transcriptional regulator with XRE-family HTH domain
MPELRTLFAGNLKRLLRGEKSIAHVCRVLDINRQQFNRYLSGESLPGKQNLKKIADYFKVSEASLILAVAQESSPGHDIGADPFLQRLSAAFGGETPSLRSGLYNFYHGSEANRKKCLRGLMIVNKSQMLTRFDALLNYRNAEAAWSSGGVVRFSGLVREQRGRLQFLGNDNAEPSTLFLAEVAPVYSSRDKLFAGLVNSTYAEEIAVRRLAIEYAEDQDHICALARRCGLTDLAGAGIASWVRAAISSKGLDDEIVFRPRTLTDLMRS